MILYGGNGSFQPAGAAAWENAISGMKDRKTTGNINLRIIGAPLLTSKIANKFIKCLGKHKTPSYKRTSPPDAKMDLHGENIDQLLEARSEIDKELRRHKSKVTIFFTDVVGSTTYFDRF